MKSLSFLIITTNNLPEAYFAADFLTGKKQRIGIVNITGRSLSRKLFLLNRIQKRHGLPYVLDLILGKLLRTYYQSSAVVPFPHISAAYRDAIRKNHLYHECRNPHSRESLEFVKKFSPDYIVIAGAPVLQRSLFGLAKYGALNRHLGLSPKYRGSDCTLWALHLNDLQNIGFTVHWVSEKVDGGNILMQKKVTADKGLDFSHFIAGVQLKASQGLIRVLDDIISGNRLTETIQEKGGNHYPPAGLLVLRGAYRNYQNFLRKQ